MLSDLLSVAAFLAWDSGDRTGRLWQLHDGVPEAMARRSETHGSIQSELGAIIRNHLLAHRPGCRVVTTPGVVPRVPPAPRAASPRNTSAACSVRAILTAAPIKASVVEHR